MSQIEINNTQPVAAITREPEKSQKVGYIPAPFEKFHDARGRLIMRTRTDERAS
jgi:hypothetical protein